MKKRNVYEVLFEKNGYRIKVGFNDPLKCRLFHERLYLLNIKSKLYMNV